MLMTMSRIRGYFHSFPFVTWSFFVLLAFWCGQPTTVNAQNEPKVDSVWPREGSLNGGTRITIKGKNFAASDFTLSDDAEVGNKVTLTSLETYPCQIHPDGTTAVQVTCYTPSNLPADVYDVRVKVNGVDVDDNRYCSQAHLCQFTAKETKTPTIERVVPLSGLPGELITLYGDLKTMKYGSNLPDDTESNIVRVYFGSQKCELREGDEFYKLIYNEESKDGVMTCKPQGTFVGNNNISYLISQDFGRSLEDGKTKYPRSNGISMYQTFTEIKSVSLQKGSIHGGTTITLTGKHFDETVKKAKVMIAGAPCEVSEAVNDTDIVCTTTADVSSEASHFTGGRGLYAYVYPGVMEAGSINKTTTPRQHLDSSEWRMNMSGPHTVLIEGFYRPVITGNYRFCVKAASTATVYLSTDSDPANKTEVATGTSRCSQNSFIPLEKEMSYFIEVHYQKNQADSDSYMKVSAFLKESMYTEEQTGWAMHETQTIRIFGDTDPEIQVLNVTASGNTPQTNDVQTLAVSGDPTLYFALGVNGIFTTAFTLETVSADGVKNALQQILGSEYIVSVQMQEQNADRTFVITTNFPQGSIGKFDGIQLNGADNALYFTHTHTTIGAAASNYFTLSLNGSSTAALQAGASANMVKTKLEKLFGVECHPKLNEGYLIQYETKHHKWNNIVSNMEPFCGRYSVKNPSYIFYGGDKNKLRTNLNSRRMMCLAYKGMGDIQRLLVHYENSNEGETKRFYQNIYPDASTDLKKWRYWCTDLYTVLQQKSPGSNSVIWVRAYRKTSDYDLYIDHLAFRTDSPKVVSSLDDVSSWRKLQVKPNGFFVKSVTVSSSAQNEYRITLIMHNCGNHLPIFTALNGDVSREQNASIPIEGTYTISLMDDTTDPITVTAEAKAAVVRDLLANTKVGFSQVEGWGTCSSFSYKIKMVSLVGDQPLLAVDISQLTGQNVQSSVTVQQHGGLYYDPIVGDLLRTYHPVPNVIAYINGIPTRCAEMADCSFLYSSDSTPRVDSISPESGAEGISVVISGSGFSNTMDNNVVFLGKTPCVVTAANASSITCNPDNGPTGPADVTVMVKGYGYAESSVVFKFITGVSSFSQLSGSLGGGTLLTVKGFGFAMDAIVTVDGGTCEIININASCIQCLTPRSATLSVTIVDVNITQVGHSEKVGNFSYDLGKTPIILTVNTTRSSVKGGEIIQIAGVSFGNDTISVKLGGVELNVSSLTDNEVIAVLPALPQGRYQLMIHVPGRGFAELRTNQIPDIYYVFVVNSISPHFGSVYGGTDLYLTGEGFQKPLLSIHVGSHKCAVTSANDTHIKCRLSHTRMRHNIFANGTSAYGPGYAWNRKTYTIQADDIVTWHWEIPTYVKDIAYGVHQTATGTDLINLEGGFSSGSNSKKGSFSHHFTVPGKYFYWTGYADSGAVIYFRGVITVQPRKSSIGILSVKMLGSDAFYNTSATEPEMSNSCPSVTTQVAGCVDNSSLTVPSNQFGFQFLQCHSPYFVSLSRTNGSFGDTISLEGESLGNKTCQFEVTYGDNGCTTIVDATTSLDFMISPVCEPPVGVLHKFQVRVDNVGYALMSLPISAYAFGLIPMVNSLTPHKGSKVGGTMVTISGAGFVGDANSTLVESLRMQCVVQSVSYTQIVCKTVCSSTPGSCFVGEMNFAVTIGQLPANCEDPVCQFETTIDTTPEIYNVTPTSISSASTELTFVGTKLQAGGNQPIVMIGKFLCSNSSTTDNTTFTCSVGRLPVGDNTLMVYVPNLGYAVTMAKVTSEKIATITAPSESSTNGGATLMITGNGFVEGMTNVKVNNEDCPITGIDLSQISCTLPANPVGSADVIITSNSQVYPTLAINYTTESTPQVNSIDPEEGLAGISINITGSNFSPPSGLNVTVTIGGISCAVKSVTDDSIMCDAGAQNTGKFRVKVLVEGKGSSNEDSMFTYKLGTFTISPTAGSTNGGQEITLSGSGFLKDETNVTICGQKCVEVMQTATEFTCKTSSHAAGQCDVVAEVRGVIQTKAAAYTYDANLVSTVTQVSPSRGGTGGGTRITIQGTNFGTNATDVTVTIGYSTCVVETIEDTSIVCVTGSSTKTLITDVEVTRAGWGLAQQISARFEYIDLWSSRFTWGDEDPPSKGQFVVIPKGKKIVLDVNTPVLQMLLIQGGHLIFDEKDIELSAYQILITDGGILDVGTEAKPFEHKAIITLHGHVRSKELPVYGAKGIGIREGMLNLYGQHVPITWTTLSNTADADATTIVLTHEVTWKAGDEIVIASTGDRFSQNENEIRRIASINADKRTITLDQKLEHEHIGRTITLGSRTVELRGEVGLLTRNVVVRGYRNKEFDTKIEACPDGFNPGEFATQTCFQGRFGEEVGSDQYGVHILVHQAEKDTQVAQIHLSYIEVTHAGQAFRLGRYPIHFHMNGNMNQSFVRGCAIHRTFNRAVNIHGSHYAMVEHNVIYDVMGGALFLEDGIEMENTFQYNLEVFIRSSTSLLNDDVTPAAIWVTNPYNYIRHNAAAGGTHFGVWYRMHDHPDGPSTDSSICLRNTPLGDYSNNTAHSLGWFGLWIFETYVPKDNLKCNQITKHQVAKFESLLAWNNNEGAEAVNAGAIQFHNFVVINNEKSGIHFSLITGSPPQYDEDNGPGVFNSVIVARYDGLKGKSTGEGIVQPHYNGFLMKNIEFYNFDQTRSSIFNWVTIAGVCMDLCGGFTTASSNLQFINSPRKVNFQWENEGVIRDLDGSLTGSAGESVVPCSAGFDPKKCTQKAEFSFGKPGCVCKSDIKLIRFAFNDIKPEGLRFKTALFKSAYGITESGWRFKRITHKEGSQAILMANTEYDLSFEDAPQLVNISYNGRLYGMSAGDYLILTQNAYQMPDRLSVDNSDNKDMSATKPNNSTVSHGAWYYNNTASEITYVLQNTEGTQLGVKFQATRCLYRGCEPPENPLSVIKQPSNAEYTSIPATWNNVTMHGDEPKPMDDLYIGPERWIVVNTVLPRLGKVVIDGGLQFSENFTEPNLLEADYIYIKGRLIVGWSDDNPFLGKLTIRLRGQHSTPNYKVTDGPNLGSKFIAVFGGLQLHGIDRGVTKTYLANEASPGDSVITVMDAVEWNNGEDILITTTDYDTWHTEVFQIVIRTGRSITLNGTIKHRHIAHTEMVDGKRIELRANVALLNRNIKVEGADYNELIQESFGARIIVGQTADKNNFHSGFAQISNTEFYHYGQEGFTSNFDARYAVTYMGVTSTKGKVRYSYVRNNAFHNGFSPAVGVFGVDDLEIDNNLIHHSIGPGIQTESTNTQITNNLLTLSIWPGSYLDRHETQNYDFSGAIDAVLATSLVLINNTVAGSERAAYTVTGQACTASSTNLWSGNVAQSAQSGVAIFPDDKPADATCVKFSGFTFWKNFDYGIAYYNTPSLVVEDNVFIENSVGIIPFIIGPGAVSHTYADKSFTVKNNLFVGKTDSFSETLDVMPRTDSFSLSSQARGLSTSAPCGKAAILIGTFTSGSNSSPRKPWLAIMSYNAINGITKITGNAFSNFSSCGDGNSYDHVVGTNKNNDDAIHPAVISQSSLFNVDHKAKVFFHIPNVDKINSADCVDMDCDAHKKCILTDSDGSFFGQKGTALPNAAYEWGGDQRHGLGNYRIPTSMLTTPSGRKLNADTLAPHKGLYKIDECTWIPEWVAYECTNNLKWKMLIAESLDADTETRRLSPVAVFNREGYIDLINGPQDHGWCSGYTCRKRVSTFPILVALDQPFELYLTSKNPDKMRFLLLNSQPSECVRLSMWYTSTNRLEVTVDGTIVTPTNGFTDRNGRYRLRFEQYKDQYMPVVGNNSVGESYVNQDTQMIYWIQCGGAEVVITKKDAFMVSFALPPMTVDEFFGENLVGNLAAFLKIDPKNVRIVNIVSENQSGNRKKRQTSATIIVIEISSAPADTTSTTINFVQVRDSIVTLVQHGSVSEVLKTDVLFTAVSDIGSNSSSTSPSVIPVPGHLVLDIPPRGNVAEERLFSVQPKLKVTDVNGKLVSHLGTENYVWEIEASIKSGGIARSRLLGTTRISFVDGWANFTNLAINDLGNDYVIEFRVVAPAEATNFSVDALPITIFGRSLEAKVTILTTKRLTGSPIQLVAGIVDTITRQDLVNIGFDAHTWEAKIEADTSIYSGRFIGTTTMTLDPVTGVANFTDLQMDTPGSFPVTVTIKSNPAGYSLTASLTLDAISPGQATLVVQESHTMELSFPITYRADRANIWAAQVANDYGRTSGLKVVRFSHRSGSTIIILHIEASTAGYNNTLHVMCDDAEQGKNFTFDGTTVTMSPSLIIDGKQYYGVKCGPIPPKVNKDDGDGLALDVVYIVIIAVLLALVLILAALLIYKFCIHKSKSGSHKMPSARVSPVPPPPYSTNKDYLEDILQREESFSAYTSPRSPAIPPRSTRSITPFEMEMKTPDLDLPSKGPSPAWDDPNKRWKI